MSVEGVGKCVGVWGEVRIEMWGKVRGVEEGEGEMWGL